MQISRLHFHEGFSVAAGNGRSQAAVMVLASGEATGGPDNRHHESDQWLFVVSGDGSAIIDGATHDLRAGVLLLIERGESHEIRSGDSGPLRTLNFYVPPEY